MSNSKYSTQNLYEASYLLAKGLKLLGKERQGSKFILLFEERAREEALRFYNGATIQAKKYADSYRTTKDYIFER